MNQIKQMCWLKPVWMQKQSNQSKNDLTDWIQLIYIDISGRGIQLNVNITSGIALFIV